MTLFTSISKRPKNSGKSKMFPSNVSTTNFAKIEASMKRNRDGSIAAAAPGGILAKMYVREVFRWTNAVAGSHCGSECCSTSAIA